MRNILDKVFKNQSLLYKYFLYLVSVACIVFFFPKGGKFKYEFQKGKPWQYENLYAPFDFSIQKDNEDISKEKAEFLNNQIDYYRLDPSVQDAVSKEYEKKFYEVFTGERFSGSALEALDSAGKDILRKLYKNGILAQSNKRRL